MNPTAGCALAQARTWPRGGQVSLERRKDSTIRSVSVHPLPALVASAAQPAHGSHVTHLGRPPFAVKMLLHHSNPVLLRVARSQAVATLPLKSPKKPYPNRSGSWNFARQRLSYHRYNGFFNCAELEIVLPCRGQTHFVCTPFDT